VLIDTSFISKSDTLLSATDSISLDSTATVYEANEILDSAALAQARRDTIFAKIDSAFDEFTNQGQVLSQAVSQARFLKSTLSAESTKIRSRFENLNKHIIEHNKKFAQAFACLVFFLIGAPLGAIIKRGGLGIPVIISIIFFIFYYVITMTGEKWARQGVVDPFWGVWGANLILLPIGLFFLKQARNDARLFDADFYNVFFNKLKIFVSRFLNRPDK
ncbi:MAG: LptF/LptG family permease, partial [Cyclobacteriaceae bacterium]